MLLGKFKGRQVHFYQMDGCEFYVVRGSRFAAAMCWNARLTAVAVLVPPGMSYKQGAMRAAAMMKTMGDIQIENQNNIHSIRI